MLSDNADAVNGDGRVLKNDEETLKGNGEV